MAARSNQRGQFKKGFDSHRNSKGRPKGTSNRLSIADLASAIKKVEKKKHKTFMEAWLESAWGDATAMSNIANYMLPRLKSIEGVISTFESSMDDELGTIHTKPTKEKVQAK